MATPWLALFGVILAFSKIEPAAAAGASPRFVCYVNSPSDASFSECTHIVYVGEARGDKLDEVLKVYRKNSPGTKILLRVTDNDKDLRSTLKSRYVQGLEVFEAHKTFNKTKISNYVEKAKQAVSSAGNGQLFLSLPAHPELLAKYYDLRSLMKVADLMTVQTHALGLVKEMTYHPSRLSGLWDMMNTDSVVDLVIGLGVPPSKLIISLPATARQFKLRNETLSTPGSPTEEDEPLEIDQTELCRHLSEGRWTLERDQDLAAPYAFKNKTWISFEDPSSVDVKGKYARVRGLAGLALYDADRDVNTSCGPSLRAAISKVLNSQSRAPRAAVLRSLENEILSSSHHHGRPLDALQVSPYRITQVVDSDGVIHSLREDTRTEFSCSRQGYFVHPRSCARFYRCVKFDQLSPDYTVFEFDCPAGLAFDARYEVCVWPGSLPHSQACPGSSEIAPVPQSRFVCPEHEGYFADPENCRWFFACIDHGKAPMAAYEFRCPFGLGFDAARLQCDWPWLVPACGNIGRYEAEAHGFSGAVLTGATGFYGKTPDAVNVAAHQSLVSGAALDNLVGIQGGFLSKGDAFDENYVISQSLADGTGSFGYQNTHNANLGAADSGFTHQISHASNEGRLGLKQQNNVDGHYTSGSLILDEYRLPSHSKISTASDSYAGSQQRGYTNNNFGVVGLKPDSTGLNQNSFYQESLNIGSNSNLNVKPLQFQTTRTHAFNQADESGAYIHDPSGDYAVPYKHVDSPTVPYVHDDRGYKSYNDYNDYSKYKESFSIQRGNNGQYVPENSAQYEGNFKYSYENGNDGSYAPDYSGDYKVDHTGTYASNAGTSGNKNYQINGNINPYLSYHGGSSLITSTSGSRANGKINYNQYEAYSNGNNGEYVTDDKAFTGVSHNLAAGAINFGLVGKTTLVDAEYSDQNKYQNSGAYSTASHSQTVNHVVSYPNSLPTYFSGSGVSISHAGTDTKSQNVNTFSYVTTPTTSAIPTTATPIAVTSSIPVTTYKTTYVPQQPKTSVKQILEYSQPDITFVQPTTIAVTSPKIEFSQSQGAGNIYEENKFDNSNSFLQTHRTTIDSSGYDYPKPTVSFEDGIKTFSSLSPATKVYVQPEIVKSEPRGFSHNTVHNVESVRYNYEPSAPISEEQLKKAYAYTTSTPAAVTYTQPTISTYVPQTHSLSHQTIHTVDTSKINQYSVPKASGLNYEYNQPIHNFYQTPSNVEYTTAQPGFVETQAPVSYNSHVFSHQTVHTVEGQSSNPVISTPTPRVEVKVQNPAVTVYENPLIKRTQKITPALTYVSSTPLNTEQQTDFVNSYAPQVQHHEVKHIQQQQFVNQNVRLQQPIYSFDQPEIQQSIELGSGLSYPEPSVIRHQIHHEDSSRNKQSKILNKNVVFVTTTPAKLIHEEHYSEYEAPQDVVTYKVADFITPKSEYVQPVVISTPRSVVDARQNTFIHNQNKYNYGSDEYSEHQSGISLHAVQPLQQVSFTTQYSVQPNLVNRDYVSSYSSRPVTSTYKPIVYQSPEIQVGYNSEDYLPSAVSHVKSTIPTVKTQTYSPITVSTTSREYLPPPPKPISSEHLTPKIETYSTPITVQPIIKSTTPIPTFRYETSSTPVFKAQEYLPPLENVRNEPNTVHFESFGLRNIDATSSRLLNNPFNEFSTQQSITSPEYATITPPQRKQNIVVQQAKSNLLGFGTVGPNAGIVSEFSRSTLPSTISPVTQNYVGSSTSTFAPYNQELLEVTPSPTPIRRTKPRVSVVTKVNDFNPFLVRKLGAVCSCQPQSQGLVLKGKRPTTQSEHYYDNYSNDYGKSGRGDINEYEISQNSERIQVHTVPQAKTVTVSPIVKPTFNPIIVPDASYYQDYQEPKGREVESVSYVSSTPAASYVPSTDNNVRIRSRVKEVTTAPTYKTVLLNQEVSPTAVINESQESLAFDRYGPGGWRSRDETLQGTVDCQRAGLFRHPKQCNKFYACRWDCTKQRFTLHVFNCPVQLSFDPKLGACNWPSQGPACQGDTLLINTL